MMGTLAAAGAAAQPGGNEDTVLGSGISGLSEKLDSHERFS